MMVQFAAAVGTLLVLSFTSPGNGNIGATVLPEFTEPVLNLSIALGRDAIFKCLVRNLGAYKVGWVQADTKAIQAIHTHVVTQNSRISVSHDGTEVWRLHIKNVREEDGGFYMCQINTDPMMSQVGHLTVLIPPDFVSDRTSGDILVAEGSTVRLRCSARGRPDPRVLWRREDGQDLLIRTKRNQGITSSVDESANSLDILHKSWQRHKRPMSVIKVQSYQGEMLTLEKFSRSEMGAYLCIAYNGVPPTISKRIMVQVLFMPVVHVPNQLVGAPLGTTVQLECHVESSPFAICYWLQNSDEMVVPTENFNVQTYKKSLYEVTMVLQIKNLRAEDLGSYRCVAKNSLGEVESRIRLYEIPGPTGHLSSSYYSSYSDEDDFRSSEETRIEILSDDNDAVRLGLSESFSRTSYTWQNNLIVPSIVLCQISLFLITNIRF